MKVLFHKNFKKQYKKLSPKIQAGFNERLRLLLIDENDPLLRVHKLAGNKKPLVSINVTADYRALFLKTKNNLTFIEIGTHSELYR